jgi:uncharacterized RDD family membrane protein YckC
MSDTQILDTHLQHSEYNILNHLASSGKRFANSLVDGIIVLILYFAVGVIFVISGHVSAQQTGLMQFSGLIIQILYFIIMESAFGKTVGKMITGTEVVTVIGGKPSFGQIVGRSFCRLIPFDAFSYLGGNPGWHDTISGTRVVTVSKDASVN